MPPLGTTGKNHNFAPDFTVPGAMTLDGYAVGQDGATKLYRSIDIRRVILKSKLAAVKTAADALGARIAFLYGGWPQDATAGASGFRLHLSHPARGASPPWVAANVTILLANIETAVTT